LSLDAQDWVWNHSQAKSTARLVLLAIADKASGTDCSAYAGTTMLIQRANAARSSVIVAVDRLVESGELAIVEGATGPRGETRYALPKAVGHRREGGLKSGPPRNPDRSEIRTPRGTKSGPPRSEIRTPTGPKSGPHNAVNADTTEGTQKEGAEASSNWPRPTTPTAQPDGLTPIDVDSFELTDPMRAWALRTFGPNLDLDYETAQFVDHFRAQNVRRPNWPTEWQKWVRRSAKFASERANRPGSNVVRLPSGQTLTGTDAKVAGWAAIAAQLAEQGDSA
jgi:hypothetical protein